MKFLHSSDWHLGRRLYGRQRYEEFGQLLAWLAETIEAEQVDALLLAGDIFDSGAPSNNAQELYYSFLARVAANGCCRHVVVIAGNHDSPAFLEAPKALLRALNVRVVGSVGANLADEVLVLKDRKGEPEAIVCAVPYLRDKDLRKVGAGESSADKDNKLLAAIHEHYARVGALAAERMTQCQNRVPIIALGHLFASGGSTVEGDGVRELYVGALARVGADAFPDNIDYLALGHLHQAQCLAQQEHLRYCGAPLALGFGEKGGKQVLIVEFDSEGRGVRPLAVPQFQRLERCAGDLDSILATITKLKAEQSSAWLEVEYNGKQLQPDLRALIESALAGSELEVLCIRNSRVASGALEAQSQQESLADLDCFEVFERCLDSQQIPSEQRGQLLSCYQEIVQKLEVNPGG